MDSLKDFKKEQEREMLKLLLVKWLCNKNAWAAKHMHELASLLGKEFTTLDLPYKNSRAYELVKEWESKGLVRVTDYTSKARKYVFAPTIFAKTIEEQEISKEAKEGLLNILDELIKPINKNQ